MKKSDSNSNTSNNNNAAIANHQHSSQNEIPIHLILPLLEAIAEFATESKSAAPHRVIRRSQAQALMMRGFLKFDPAFPPTPAQIQHIVDEALESGFIKNGGGYRQEWLRLTQRGAKAVLALTIHESLAAKLRGLLDEKMPEEQDKQQLEKFSSTDAGAAAAAAAAVAESKPQKPTDPPPDDEKIPITDQQLQAASDKAASLLASSRDAAGYVKAAARNVTTIYQLLLTVREVAWGAKGDARQRTLNSKVGAVFVLRHGVAGHKGCMRVLNEVAANAGFCVTGGYGTGADWIELTRLGLTTANKYEKIVKKAKEDEELMLVVEKKKENSFNTNGSAAIASKLLSAIFDDDDDDTKQNERGAIANPDDSGILLRPAFSHNDSNSSTTSNVTGILQSLGFGFGNNNNNNYESYSSNNHFSGSEMNTDARNTLVSLYSATQQQQQQQQQYRNDVNSFWNTDNDNNQNYLATSTLSQKEK